jgi:Lrp/AsnC family leucine-responsive transcriptional regulator
MQLDPQNAIGILDETDELLITELSRNGRSSASALAESIGLTRQAATSRMDRLKNEGIIRNYTVALDPDKIHLPVRAFISITLMPACSQEAEDSVIALLRDNRFVQECYRVTGDDYFQVRVVAPNIMVIREIVVSLRATGVVQGTSTVLALETMFEKSHIGYGCLPTSQV